MSSTKKYTAHHNGQLVGKRNSKRMHVTYTHAVVIWQADKDPKVGSWCSRPDLARTKQNMWQRWGWHTAIVPAEVIQ